MTTQLSRNSCAERKSTKWDKASHDTCTAQCTGLWIDATGMLCWHRYTMEYNNRHVRLTVFLNDASFAMACTLAENRRTQSLLMSNCVGPITHVLFLLGLSEKLQLLCQSFFKCNKQLKTSHEEKAKLLAWIRPSHAGAPHETILQWQAPGLAAILIVVTTRKGWTC